MSDGRAHRGLRGDHSGGRRNGPEPERDLSAEAHRAQAEAEGRSDSGGWRRPAILAGDAKAVILPMDILVDEHRRRKIAGRSHCRPEPLAVRSPPRRPGCDQIQQDALPSTELSTSIDEHWVLSDLSRREQEAGDVFRCELNSQCCLEGVEAEDVQIFVEVTEVRRQCDRFDADGLCALRQY